MPASTFYYYSAKYKDIKRITWILLVLIQYYSDSKHFNVTGSVSWLPNQFRKHYQSKQQPFKGEDIQIFGKGGEPYMGGLSILWEDLITP